MPISGLIFHESSLYFIHPTKYFNAFCLTLVDSFIKMMEINKTYDDSLGKEMPVKIPKADLSIFTPIYSVSVRNESNLVK
ncbi:hypothetical protein MTBBW1_1260046 [Desulfamplus magnetovallimortis]|uniref:Uncharacterized protein n=1 Tax=Desulfamplus magnetovallimortis TaxID=1246637 RepID=A0A1W1H6Q7_9BACT|nr:hypothetical protein MTBBW1_1260046 [Desulfamplus magnetovallimortis]